MHAYVFALLNSLGYCIELIVVNDNLWKNAHLMMKRFQPYFCGKMDYLEES